MVPKGQRKIVKFYSTITLALKNFIMPLILILIMLFFSFGISAQTCCTAGAPVSSFYGIQAGVEKTWAVNLAYEFKSINLLIDQNDRLVNDPRTRSGQSLSAKVDYILNRKWSFSAILPFVQQTRKTVSANESSLGLGDLLFISQYTILNKNDFSLKFSAGLKVPTGKRNHRSDSFIFLSPDMQSGSGSFDWIARIHLIKEHFLLPFLTSTFEVSYRDNGINPTFGKTSNFNGRRFGFGDEWVSMVSFNYQWITGQGIFIPDLSLRYRRSTRNIEQNVGAPNSGGSWWSLPFGISFQPDQIKSIRVYAELPLFQDLNGLQITTNFTAGLQIRYIINNEVVRK